VDVLSAGAVIWRTLLRRITDATQGRVRNVVTSEHDILDGTAITVARGTLGR
jgi:exopolyphosphatase/guanosine-5'-triphosphate,3'-diphosphate pyrophosphatase